MEQLIAILNGMHPDVDFSEVGDMIGEGVLDSLDIVTLITEINDAFDVNIPAEEVVPENFATPATLWTLIERLDEE